MKSKNKIYLIGLPGTGKSHFGKVLEEEIGIPFFDLDDLIEEKEGRAISEIFEKEGEDYFRKVESEMLHSVSSKSQFILATGGGSPCFHDGIQFMNNNGVTVYLTEKKAVLVNRLSIKSHRPLMQDDIENKIDELLKTRSQYYDQADLVISHRNANEAYQQILSLKS